MPKQIIFEDEAREKFVKGVNIVARAVITTLGPKGRNVALESMYTSPRILHDGVSVAEEIELSDRFENMGARMAKKTAKEVNKISGDGTTTTTLLLQQIVNLGMKYIASGVNPMTMKKGIDKAVTAVVSQIESSSRVLKKDDWIKVATISSQNEILGKKVAEAVALVGKDGIVEIEEGSNEKIEVVHKEGMTFNKGFANFLFAKDEKNQTVKMKNPRFLVVSRKIDNINDLTLLLEEIIKVTKDLVIIIDEIDNKTLAFLISQKLNKVMNILVVKAPGFGDRKPEILGDVAVALGATIVSNESGLEIYETPMDYMGTAESIKTTFDETVIIKGGGTDEAIKTRVDEISKLMIGKSDFEVKKLGERKVMLSGGIASIQVGAVTESEMLDLIERAKDAKGATQSAMKSGTIPGGGVAFVRAIEALKDIKTSSDDEEMGVKLIRKVLEMPIRILAENSGEDGGWIFKTVLNHKNPNFGFDVQTGEFGDLVEMGIIEPTLIATTSLIKASSNASMILTTECLIAEEDKE